MDFLWVSAFLLSQLKRGVSMVNFINNNTIRINNFTLSNSYLQEKTKTDSKKFDEYINENMVIPDEDANIPIVQETDSDEEINSNEIDLMVEGLTPYINEIVEKLKDPGGKIEATDDINDWRNMSEEEWEKMLKRVDNDIEEMIERISEEEASAMEKELRQDV